MILNSEVHSIWNLLSSDLQECKGNIFSKLSEDNNFRSGSKNSRQGCPPPGSDTPEVRRGCLMSAAVVENKSFKKLENEFMCTNNMRCSIILFKRDHVNLHRNHATQNNCSASTDHGGAFGYRFSQNFIACLVTWMYRCRSST